MLAARLCRRDPRGRGRSAQARLRLQRRALGPLPAGRGVAPPRRPDRRRHRAAVPAQESLAGWAPTTVPNASNAGDFSNASYMGSVHWYRKDFRLPRASEASKWVLRFESVNYRARVWLNGKPLGNHVGAYLPFELRAQERPPPRDQPPRRARRQPPPEVRHPAAVAARVGRVRGRMVELQRHPAGGLPAAGRPVRLRARGLPAQPALSHVRRDGPRAGDGQEREHEGRDGPHHRALRAAATCASARTACRAGARTASAPACESATRACGAPSGPTCTPAGCSCAPRAGGSCRSTRSTRAFATSGSAGSGASS